MFMLSLGPHNVIYIVSAPAAQGSQKKSLRYFTLFLVSNGLASVLSSENCLLRDTTPRIQPFSFYELEAVLLKKCLRADRQNTPAPSPCTLGSVLQKHRVSRRSSIWALLKL